MSQSAPKSPINETTNNHRVLNCVPQVTNQSNDDVIVLNNPSHSEVYSTTNKTNKTTTCDQQIDLNVVTNDHQLKQEQFFDDELPIELHPKQFFESQSSIIPTTNKSTSQISLIQNACMQPLQIQTDIQRFTKSNLGKNSNLTNITLNSDCVLILK